MDCERLRQELEHTTGRIKVAQGIARAIVDGRKRELETQMAQAPKRSNFAMLARVISSTGREQEDEAEALIKRRQRNHARALDLIAKGHTNERVREAMIGEAEREQQLDDLEAALGGNGGPTLDGEPDEATTQARSVLAAAKKSATASSGGGNGDGH